MPTFRIRAKQTVTYEFEVEADLNEIDSTGFRVNAHTIPGQLGWNNWEGDNA